MSEIKVEVGQFRILDKGALKAVFSLVIYPTGQKILDCKYFIQGDKRWFSFPQKEIVYTDGRKTDYIPLVSYIDKEYLEQLKIAVLEALKTAKPQENYVRSQSQAHQRKENTLQPKPSAEYEEPPF